MRELLEVAARGWWSCGVLPRAVATALGPLCGLKAVPAALSLGVSFCEPGKGARPVGMGVGMAPRSVL